MLNAVLYIYYQQYMPQPTALLLVSSSVSMFLSSAGMHAFLPDHIHLHH